MNSPRIRRSGRRIRVPKLRLQQCTTGRIEAAQIRLRSGVMATQRSVGAAGRRVSLLVLAGDGAGVMQGTTAEHRLRGAQRRKRKGGKGSHGRHLVVEELL